MDMLWWQILLLTIYAGVQILDNLSFGFLAQPVMAGLISGLVMGDVTTGLIIGGGMQLTILGVGTFGGASHIDANSGTVLAVAFSVAIGMNPEQALATLGVPVASLMIQTDILHVSLTHFLHIVLIAKLKKWTIAALSVTTYTVRFRGHYHARFLCF